MVDNSNSILDITNRLMSYEEGDMSEQDTISFFQDLIDSGLAWTLQGSYGRMAASLIKQGLCHQKVGA